MDPFFVLALSQLLGILGDLAGNRCVRVVYGGSADQMLFGTSMFGVLLFLLLVLLVHWVSEGSTYKGDMLKLPDAKHILDMLFNIELMAQTAALSVAFQFSEAWIYRSSWGSVIKPSASMLSPLLVMPLNTFHFHVLGKSYRCDGFVAAVVIGGSCIVAKLFSNISRLQIMTPFIASDTESGVSNAPIVSAACIMCLCYATWSVALRNSHIGQGIDAFDWVFLERVVGSCFTTVCVLVSNCRVCGKQQDAKPYYTILSEASRRTIMGMPSVLLFLCPLYGRIALQFTWLVRNESNIAIASFWLQGSRLGATLVFAWCLKRCAPWFLGHTSTNQIPETKSRNLLRNGSLVVMVGFSIFALLPMLAPILRSQSLALSTWTHRKHNVSKLHFMALGDWGCNAGSTLSCKTLGSRDKVLASLNWYSKLKREHGEPTSFLLNMGDTFYDDGLVDNVQLARIMNEYLQTLRPLEDFQGHVWYSVLGNHDRRHDTSVIVPGKHGPLHFPAKWYHWYQNSRLVHFIALDTNWAQSQSICAHRFEPAYRATDYRSCITSFHNESHQQMEWLRKILHEDDARWRVVFGHHPIFASGRWAFRDIDNNDAGLLARFLVPIFREFDVHVYIAGHDHSMQHWQAYGTGYFVFGSGGADLDEQPHYQNKFNHSAYAAVQDHSVGEHGFGAFEVNETELCVTSISATLDSDPVGCFTSCLHQSKGWGTEPTCTFNKPTKIHAQKEVAGTNMNASTHASVPDATAFQSFCKEGDHGWPRFENYAELQQSPWAAYLKALYGELPFSGWPICLYDFWVLDAHNLKHAKLSLNRSIMRPICWRKGCRGYQSLLKQGDVFQTRGGHPYLRGPGFWIFHLPFRPGGFPSNGWIEVMHMAGGLTGEKTACWLSYARGSGIWFNLGNTRVYRSHREAFVDLCDRQPRKGEGQDEPLVPCAQGKGIDSFQVHLWFFPNEFEIVAVKYAGMYSCCTRKGGILPSSFRAGWHASRPCNCDPKQTWLNCKTNLV